MSYTGGYLATTPRAVVVDLRRMNRIVEISEQDLFITVEAGVTWRDIHAALTPLKLRLPFFGTFSGACATVGGGMSNGALFMATARHGTAAEIVLGLEVITAAGAVVATGQGAFHNGRPFYRTYGPDLTGLFVHDAGALGIKSRISMRLMRTPQHLDYASFAFAGQDGAVAALSDIGRSGTAEEAYVFDPVTTRNSLGEADLARDLKRLAGVVRAQGGLLKGLKAGAAVAAGGRGFIADEVYSLHLVFAGRSAAAVAADKRAATELAARHGGAPIADTIPKAARANPFEPLNGILGPDGRRWAALNAKVAHSDAPALIRRTRAILDDYAERMRQHGVEVSQLCIAIANHAFSYEPVLRWSDEWHPVHRRTPEPSHLKKLVEPPPDPAARKLVDEIRRRIVELFAEVGAASNQIGKTYRYAESLQPQTLKLVTALKAELDPHGLMNPGALGLPHNL